MSRIHDRRLGDTSLACPRCAAATELLFWEPVNGLTLEVYPGWWTAISDCGAYVDIGEIASTDRHVSELPREVAELLDARCGAVSPGARLRTSPLGD